MMKRQSTIQQKSQGNSQRGQSLVEVALFFPIFIILLAGLVEVSQLLITQNRISSAARASTRFAANGGQDEGMVEVALNNVTQTLALDPEVWDIWSIRATVNDDGVISNDGENWQFSHIYGISNTVRYDEVNEDNIRTRVEDELRLNEFVNPEGDISDGLRIVGTYAIHDVDSILGLDAMAQLAGFSSIDSLSIMRITATSQNATNGCAAFPIAVHEGARSVTDPALGGSNPYPNSGEFTYPTNPPVYESFVNHDDNVPLRDAQEGDVFKVQNGFGNGNFGWLVWNEGITGSAGTLANSLGWPGDSTNYTPCSGGSGGCPPGQGVPGSGYNYNVPGYIEPGDPTDQELHIGDWVAGSTGSINSSFVQDEIEDHVSLDRELRLIVWDESNGQGSNGRYRISGYAIFRIVGYSLDQSGGGSWILAEFVRWDDSCGQVD